jgi:hypothetical protein
MFNSLWRNQEILLIKIIDRLGIIQNLMGKNINPRIVLIQFKGKLKKLVIGSKILNKLFIIFKVGLI